jgi:hypothetical protein
MEMISLPKNVRATIEKSVKWFVYMLDGLGLISSRNTGSLFWIISKMAWTCKESQVKQLEERGQSLPSCGAEVKYNTCGVLPSYHNAPSWCDSQTQEKEGWLLNYITLLGRMAECKLSCRSGYS